MSEQEQILADLDRLSPKQQRRAADLVHGLVSPLPAGASVEDLLQVAGRLDEDSVRQMMKRSRRAASGWTSMGGRRLLDTNVAIRVLNREVAPG
jgi:hypothetical protein